VITDRRLPTVVTMVSGVATRRQRPGTHSCSFEEGERICEIRLRSMDGWALVPKRVAAMAPQPCAGGRACPGGAPAVGFSAFRCRPAGPGSWAGICRVDGRGGAAGEGRCTHHQRSVPYVAAGPRQRGSMGDEPAKSLGRSDSQRL
jgi:hypothetical protein